jgi:predicted  nucleic acid-binding Zn-ribbon protein
MQSTIVLALALLAGAPASLARAEEVSPITKVLEMLADLETKIIKEGEVAQKEYAEYAEWCEDKSKDLQYEIKTGKSQVAELDATIAKEAATIEELTAKIEDLSAKVATADADLKSATEIRAKEAADFAAEEKELSEVLSALTRAIGILSAGSSAALLQSKFPRTTSVVQALSALVQASVLNSADGDRLTALVQEGSSGGDDEDDIGEPDVAAYESHSGGIIETLEGLKDKAEDQLAKARKTEQTALYNFDLLKQSLTDESKVASSEMEEAKTATAASKEAKGVAEGDLDVTSKDLAADVKELAETHATCMTTAEDFEAATKSRGEELGALAAAKKVLKEMTGAAADLSYGLNQVSFLQVGDKPHAVVRYMLQLARKQNSKSLAQLARRISSTIRLAHGQDPFAKVKGLISDMITRLESEGEADASHKAYCDKETSETTAKKEDKTAEVEKLTTAIDKMTSRIAVLEEEVATLTGELAELAKSQAGYEAWFKEQEETFFSNKKDMEAGIEGVQIALKVLKDYYAKSDKAHVSAEGAGGGIIGLLEVAESDFTKGLAEMSSTYDSQKVAFTESTKENEITVTAKNQDVKYKSEEITNLKKALEETTQDRAGVQTELDAVEEYLAKINEQCIEKAEPYEETKARREAEIAGLKEALSILEGEAVLLQSKSSKTRLRAGHRAQLRGGASVL